MRLVRGALCVNTTTTCEFGASWFNEPSGAMPFRGDALLLSFSREKHAELNVSPETWRSLFPQPGQLLCKTYIYVYSTVVNRSEQCGPKRVKPAAWDGPEGRLCVMTVRDAFCIGSFLLFPLDFLLRMWE